MWKKIVLQCNERFRECLLNLGVSEQCADEFLAYLGESFGNAERLDYGTGHELNFLTAMITLIRGGYLNSTTYSSIVCHIFPQYFAICRSVQEIYSLEPAGSRGAWGLDDFHFLPFLLGAHQFLNQDLILPSDSIVPGMVFARRNSFLYFEAVARIIETKTTAPLHETSPTLWGISGAADWSVRAHTWSTPMHPVIYARTAGRKYVEGI